jgi:predicted nucleic acid-binding protein
MFALRQNFSAYDAATYVALAEGLSGSLLTAAEPLVRAVGEHTAIAIIP